MAPAEADRPDGSRCVISVLCTAVTLHLQRLEDKKSTFLHSRYPRYYVADSDDESLLRAQNPTYGVVERGEIHTGVQREREGPVLRKIILSLALLSFFSILANFYQAQNAAEEQGQRRGKEEQKRQEREEEARKRASIAWIGLEPGHCLRYKLKEYTATLSHVPLGLNGIEECWNKSIEIHGRQWFPSQCEDQVCKILMRLLSTSLTFVILKSLCGRITGHWQVDFDEPSCTPWWSYSTDKVRFQLSHTCRSSYSFGGMC